jgi:hypothetical protein
LPENLDKRKTRGSFFPTHHAAGGGKTTEVGGKGATEEASLRAMFFVFVSIVIARAALSNSCHLLLNVV